MEPWIIDGLEVIAKRRGNNITQGDVLIVEAALKALKRSHGPNGKTWTDGDFLDQALTNATGSILSQYAADVIRKRAIELRLSATGMPSKEGQ